jgi:hypothetical protein
MAFFTRLFGWFRRKPQEEVYDERHAYERCHGTRVSEIVVMPKPPPKPRVLPKLAGDHLRRCFEERLEARGLRGVERPDEPQPLAEGGVGPQDDRLGGSVDEDPLELLRRKAMIAADRSRDHDPVEPLGLPEPLERVGGRSSRLDARVHR